jgi:3-oxoacyl-[acyl-carrier protein] reductase
MDSAYKKVFITGATRGIGGAIAEELAEKGMEVIGTATTPEGAEKITKALASAKNPGKGVVFSLSDKASLEESLDNILKIYGPFDIVINNAAIADDQLVMRMKQDQWNSVIDVNLNGSYRVVKSLLRPMVKKRWGRIVNISSVVAMTGNLGQANYAAAKAGVIAMSKSLAYEVSRYGVTVNCVAPGFIQTDMTAKLADNAQENILKQIPMGKMGQPEDIAKAVAFLVSDGAQYITGTTMHVNGGMLMV